jgi:membrane-associated protease RseP (regulator of RpoE activity)
MRFAFVFAFLAAAFSATGPAHAQSALQQFENKAKAPAAAAPAARAPGPGLAPATEAAPPSGYLGVVADDTPEPGKGVLLTGVRPGAPSELGGLKAGDVIIAIDGKPCRNLDDLDKALEKGTVGTKLVMTVQRQGKEEKKTITLGTRPVEGEAADNPGEAPPADAPAAEPPLPAPSLPGRGSPVPEIPGPTRPASPAIRGVGDDPLPAPPSSAPPATATPRDPALDLPPPPAGDRPASDSPLPATEAPAAEPPAADAPASEPPALGGSGKASLGIQVVPLNDETRSQYRTAARQGAVIVVVRPGSPADLAGLPIGGVVVSIDGQLVQTADDLVEAISAARPGQEVELRYYHGDRLLTRAVRLAPAAARGVIPSTRAPQADAPRADGPRGPADRPLLRKFEDMVESLGPQSPPRTTVGSTIIDPSVMAEMHADIKAMKEKLDAIETRIKTLEDKAAP